MTESGEPAPIDRKALDSFVAAFGQALQDSEPVRMQFADMIEQMFPALSAIFDGAQMSAESIVQQFSSVAGSAEAMANDLQVVLVRPRPAIVAPSCKNCALLRKELLLRDVGMGYGYIWPDDSFFPPSKN